ERFAALSLPVAARLRIRDVVRTRSPKLVSRSHGSSWQQAKGYRQCTATPETSRCPMKNLMTTNTKQRLADDRMVPPASTSGVDATLRRDDHRYVRIVHPRRPSSSTLDAARACCRRTSAAFGSPASGALG